MLMVANTFMDVSINKHLTLVTMKLYSLKFNVHDTYDYWFNTIDIIPVSLHVIHIWIQII